jgi:hypothetical protein
MRRLNKPFTIRESIKGSNRTRILISAKGFESYPDFDFSTFRSVPGVHEDRDETKILYESKP